MKNVALLSIVTASLLLVGCGEEKAHEATQAAAKTAQESPAATTPSTTEEKSAVTQASEAATNVVEKATQAVKETASAAKEAVVEKATEVKEAANKAVEATKEVAAQAVEKTSATVQEATAAVSEKVEEAKAAVSTPKVDLTACGACHGANFEKKAMGVSKIVKDMSKADIETALKGYQAGTYGGNMKTLMKGQVAKFDEAKIKAIAEQIGQ